MPLLLGKCWKRVKIKARRAECWFCYLEAKKQLAKFSLENSLPLGLEASVTEMSTQHVRGLELCSWSVTRWVHPSLSWCEQLFTMMDGGAGVGGSERDTMRKRQLLVTLTTRRDMRHPTPLWTPLTSCSSLNDHLRSPCCLSEEVLGFTDGVLRTRKDDEGRVWRGGGFISQMFCFCHLVSPVCSPTHPLCTLALCGFSSHCLEHPSLPSSFKPANPPRLIWIPLS